MIRIIPLAACAAAFSLGVPRAFAQSGSVEKAVGGYSFEDAAKEAAGTKDFHSADGKLTFAIVTHTAGNGFFDPVYVGAKVAGNLIGAKILLLGSESPTDDPAREIEILNQIVQDPTIDGLIMTTPQAGAYDDIVKAAEANGIPVATTNSFDGDASSTATASATPARTRRPRRSPARRWCKCLLDKGVDERLDRAAVLDRDGQHRGQQPRHCGLQRDRQDAERRRQARRTSRSTPARRTSASTPTRTIR